MKTSNLIELLKQQFPNIDNQSLTMELEVGSFPEWDSLGHFNLLLLIEESYGIRFSMDEMTEMKSLNEIAQSLVKKGIKD